VLLQGYSTLDEHHPGDPAVLIDYAGRLAHLFQAKNPRGYSAGIYVVTR